MSPHHFDGLLCAMFAGVMPLSVLLYAALAVLMHTRWKISDGGLELRAASLGLYPVRIAWDDMESIFVGSRVVPPYVALKLDGRYLFSRHVTIVRRAGITRLVRWTPADIDAFAGALHQVLDGRTGWRSTADGWIRG